MSADVIVVGVGADGWSGLAAAAQAELSRARIVYGSTRQLRLLPGEVRADRVVWRSPMSAHLAELADGIAAHSIDPNSNNPNSNNPNSNSPDSNSPDSTAAAAPIHVLASGDPMFHGVGASLVRAFGAERVRVIPHPSSASLAAARLGWDLARTRVVSLVTAPVETLLGHLTGGARTIVLSRDAATPADVADLLTAAGFGASSMTVLSDLGARTERVDSGHAATWTGTPSPLNIVAVDCVGPAHSRAPGLDDDEFTNDGQLTKRPIRALTVSALRPADGQTFWDIGAGAGSICIEWLRLAQTGRAVAFEADPARTSHIVENARRHGVADRLELRGAAPDALTDAPRPDTVFVGGGLSADLLERAWAALPTGGRIVANAVTLQTERLISDAADRWGGDLMRVSVERAAPLGRSTAWRPALPIVQWTAVRTDDEGMR